MNDYTNSTLDLLLKESNAIAQAQSNSISKDHWYVERNRKRNAAEIVELPRTSDEVFRKMWEELQEEARLNPYIPEGCGFDIEEEEMLF